MIYGGKRAPALLFLGDIAVFCLALWLTLLLRTGSVPSMSLLEDHAGPFALLFILWSLVFYMSGLYGKGIILFKSHQPQALVRTQFANIVLAALFFFLVPGIGIAPKTNLAIYLVVSLLLIFLWRLAVYPRLSIKRSRTKALLIADGPDAEALVEEVNGNPRYHLAFIHHLTPLAFLALSPYAQKDLMTKGVRAIVADMAACNSHGLLPVLYDLPVEPRDCDLLDFTDVYEEVFDRIPLSLLDQGWFIENVAKEDPFWYSVPKRILDILGGVAMGLITLIAIPFVWAAHRLEGPGTLFIKQSRLGERGTLINAYKFRSMHMNEHASDAWVGESDNRITKVGSVLRKTSLDEFPQFVNLLRGDLSLIGPRNDIEGLAKRLGDALPYYNFRYLVKPGITGWAQINQQYEQGHLSPQSIKETTVRLAYDFYYLKHRSLGLDLVIALKTIKRMLFRLSDW
ncbi:MAG: putative colanic acid biosysnthesis UDP-glucose lipid carrier transferase [Parcubacteria bacterium C7867-004]|nr:MAG: putative colanic acid biosysnthesis UDP-glucose lipid carrier transferase [Parcubacteria bacterium C7867-004]